MIFREGLDEVLTRARETVRTIKALAERLKGTRWRDLLMQEVIAL